MKVLILILAVLMACSNVAICPYDGAQAYWTGQARHSGNQVVGEYRHGSHTFWEVCQ